jgi:hypothetical protein
MKKTTKKKKMIKRMTNKKMTMKIRKNNKLKNHQNPKVLMKQHHWLNKAVNQSKLKLKQNNEAYL